MVKTVDHKYPAEISFSMFCNIHETALPLYWNFASLIKHKTVFKYKIKKGKTLPKTLNIEYPPDQPHLA